MKSKFLAEVKALLTESPPTVVLTGAGISEESGVPTFRDAQKGLWADFDPEELATPEGFQRNPKKVWEWYDRRRTLMKQVVPNPGHLALAQMERHLRDFYLLTQNIDDLHYQAGNRNIIELHGNIHRVKCFARQHPVKQWDAYGPIPPPCPQCGSPLRPDVVWFGEMLNAEGLEQAFDLSRQCKLFFSIGTSGLVEPAASLPTLASQSGSILVEINVEPTPLTSLADIFIQGPAGEILPQLISP